MKALVVYYSLDGNTDLIAQAIATETGADLLRLKPAGSAPAGMLRRMWWGGKQVLTKAKPELDPWTVDPDAYDIFFVGSPVWAGTYAPALRTFFDRVGAVGKSVALFCCYAGSDGRTFENMKAALHGGRVLGTASYRDPLKRSPDESRRECRKWAREMAGKAREGARG